MKIRKVARSATGDVTYLVTDTSTNLQVIQTTSRMFGSAGAAKRAAERLMAAAGRGVKRLRLWQLKAALRDVELHGRPIPDWLLQADPSQSLRPPRTPFAPKSKGKGSAAAAAPESKGKGEAAEAAAAEEFDNPLRIDSSDSS